MKNITCKVITLVTSLMLLNLSSAGDRIPKALPLEETSKLKSPSKKSKTSTPSGILYRMNPKNGSVQVIPVNEKLISEHNISSDSKGTALLAKLESKNVLGKGVSVKAIARKSNKDEFNDQDASAKTALYFSFGFGRPYWGGYNNCGYYPQSYGYSPYSYSSSYCDSYNTPYYYGGYYAPRTVYVGNCYYRPVCSPYYYGGYYYSYYNYGSCWY